MFEIRNLSLSFAGRRLLEPTDLIFERGKVYTIYGKSGVGKSSLLNKIGLLSATDPSVSYFFDGKEIDIENKKSVSVFIAEEVAFVFQGRNLINDLTVFENLRLALNFYDLSPDEIESKIDTVLADLQISSLKHAYPEDLSGGEEQRVAIARALVTGKTLILADEPTSSLDKENREKVSALLIDLAHKYHKIVLIVSHDEAMIAIGDVQLHFKDHKLVGNCLILNSDEGIKDSKKWSSCLSSSHTKLSVLKHRRPFLPRLLAFFISLVVAIAVTSINFQSLFADKYHQLVNNSLENGFLVINDSLHLQTTKVLDDFLSFDKEEITSISTSQNIQTVNPYIEFLSLGMTFDNSKDYSQLQKNFQPTLTIDGQTRSLTRNFSIQPLYQTNTTQRQIEYFDRSNEKGIYLSEQFISDEKLPNIVSGTTVTLTFYIPISLYESSIEKEGNILKGDGDLFVKVDKTYPVLGIVKKSYPFEYSPYGNTLFMNIAEMEELQNEAIQQHPMTKMALDGFPLKSWMPSAIHVLLKDSGAIPEELSRIRAISSQITILSSYENYEEFNKGLTYIRQFLMLLSLVLLILVIAVLSFVFFLLNRPRRFEVGILKSLGYSTQNIVWLFLKELIGYGKIISILASCLLVILSILAMQVLKLEISDVFKFYLTSVFTLIGLSVSVLIISGLLPIYTTCRQTVVDTIRKNG
ncbi:TPA: ATP-binding cassette domain-containing protein [Streptococcus pneumoniae]|uniref:ABC transporter ATP-binding protein/permease n=1 Tax=Streptococcus pneumoniae TaxID=1313 RepID=UPI000598BA95|nr:ATP-binding cassette domain-containing protein [Streptococcus pneumoniae]MBW5099800.1 ATP-binding cassette domain-containing protein [Streptococcus pneumoniae]MBW5124160.1 ATP-binding cassette domain-containing protein [Streptococcus pneumoniae]MBW5195193.1 ATP-binding cassette domain-containing protein [Streptococcus pneumoniae]MBW8151415.1 ATP-binding cassette domain-containing protein [Streptococcus pneumoniae]MDG7179072.1 ATP-binding cassette domain-containing protein [Streptococcus pne